jgi:hypothetical protein
MRALGFFFNFGFCISEVTSGVLVPFCLLRWVSG